uniref:Neuralized-like protein 4 n=3 Tax=Lygus hesperus TaxID=30085 RepID=A0A0A9ZGY0_LYGHE
MFHCRTGDHVKLSNGNRSATRIASEFNFGLVFSAEPLTDDQVFEIRIDKKIESWIGSLEIGITANDPTTLEFPASATDLRNGTWVLSGKSILKDGRTLQEIYRLNLDKICEGECIGVMRTSDSELEFFVNNVSHGIAAINIPPRVWAVIDVYGKVSEVSIVHPKKTSNEMDDCDSQNESLSAASLMVDSSTASTTGPEPSERLRFHERTGNLVKLSCNGRAAERMRPLDEFNNAVVMSQKPLCPDVPFEIRIDRLVEKWSGSIEVGVTTHDPAALDFPATMTNMRSGTIMMSGCGILTNGKGTKREYGEFDLDKLRVGDRIGMMRKSNGDLHYFINGLDQGVAASKVPEKVWAAVDLYGMTVKVTIVDRDEREEQNLITRRNTVLREHVLQTQNDASDDEPDDTLLFHPNCGSHAAVINNGRTAHRPNALDDFNNAVVLTNRPLKVNEVFEVRIDKMVTKWTGSIEIGVTTHAPTELEYPSTMTNVRSGTWIMTGNGVMHNGTSVMDEYGQNLDKLQAGDRVGVVIREGGSLHFLVNGEDQGEAGTGLPPKLHGVADLYGQATQATIVSHCPTCSPVTPNPSSMQELHFHSVHGRNARLKNGGKTASRPRAWVEFNDAIVITNRPLRPAEMFSVVIEKIVDRWAGSIEAGVTAIKPDDLELPGTMTDLDHDTWMLSGFAVMKDGMMMKHGYPLDLDKVCEGTVIGMKRHEDGTLHFYRDGQDMGEACGGIPEQVYPVIDLFGQCAQVSIVPVPETALESDESVCAPQAEESRVTSEPRSEPTVQPAPKQLYHKWHEVCGKGLEVLKLHSSAVRTGDSPSGGIVFSSSPLVDGELFDVCIDSYTGHWAGSLAMGVTPTPPGKYQGFSSLQEPYWYIQGNSLMYCGEVLKPHYCSSIEWLRPGNRLGVKRCADSSIHFYIDGVDQGVAAFNVPKKIYAVVDLYGPISGVKLVSKSGASSTSGDAPLAVLEIESPCDKATEEETEDPKKPTEDMDKSIEDGEMISEIHELEPVSLIFHECHGRNVQISESRLAAKRVSSYNQGLVLAARGLSRGSLFQIKIESLNSRWVSSLSIGVTTEPEASTSLPVTALGLKKDTWVVSGDSVFHNGHKIKSRYGVNLDTSGLGSTVGVMVDGDNQLHVVVNGRDQGVAATNISPSVSLPLVDLYGACDQVCIVTETSRTPQSPCGISEHVWSDCREKGNLEIREKPGTLRTKSDKMNENIQCSSQSSPTTASVPPPASLILERRTAANESLAKSPTTPRPISSPGPPRESTSVPSLPPVLSLPLKRGQCCHLAACLRLKASLGLPTGYFRKESMCFCSECLSPTSDSSGRKAMASGWACFPLRRRKEPQGSDANWDEAYLHAEPGQLRMILDAGKLLTPGELSLGGDFRKRADSKLDDTDSAQLVITPFLGEASQVQKQPFIDPKTKERHVVATAFEVVVRPDSYKVASETEWVTKERNATCLNSLLIRLEPG